MNQITLNLTDDQLKGVLKILGEVKDDYKFKEDCIKGVHYPPDDFSKAIHDSFICKDCGENVFMEKEKECGCKPLTLEGTEDTIDCFHDFCDKSKKAFEEKFKS